MQQIIFMDTVKRIEELREIYSIEENILTIEESSCSTSEEAARLSPAQILNLSHAAKQCASFAQELEKIVRE